MDLSILNNSTNFSAQKLLNQIAQLQFMISRSPGYRGTGAEVCFVVPLLLPPHDEYPQSIRAHFHGVLP